MERRVRHATKTHGYIPARKRLEIIITNSPDPRQHELDLAIGVVDEYLKTSESDGIHAASHLLADDVLIIWPGGRSTTTRAAALEPGVTRYRTLQKNLDHYAAAWISPDVVQVTSRGRLYGETKAGTVFSDIRYVDVFLVRNNLIHEQHVWSDVAASGIFET